MARYKYYLWAVLIYILAFGIYVYNEYQNERIALYESIDKELTHGAKALPKILNDDFHNNLTNSDSIQSEEDMQNIKRLSSYAQMTSLTYVYSFILDGETVRFASSSASKKELQTNEGLSHYFDEYTGVTETLKKSFHDNSIHFEEAEDEWGTFRSVYIPLQTSDGKVFVVGADMRIDFIDRKLNALLFSALLQAFFYSVILIPFFIAFWIVTKKTKMELEETIHIRTKALKKSKEQMSTLFNNAEQGFLSFSNDFIIQHEYSQACKRLISNDNLAGQNIMDLLFTNEHQKELFEEALNEAFEQEDKTTIECILSLLPHELSLHKKMLSIEYKLIEKTQCMLIITDITARKILESLIKKEQETLKMIVEIVSDSELFYETQRDYEKFISSFESLIHENKTPLHNFNELYREIHTFKGTFSQFYMHSIVAFLHDIENKISSYIKENRTSNEALLSILKQSDFRTSLNHELEIIVSILGEEFFHETNYVKINSDYLRELQDNVSALLRQENAQTFQYKDIFEKILNLSHVKLLNLLRPYNNLVNQLAKRLEKDIYDFKVIGDSTIVVSEAYKPFVKSLIHVFRNCIDHGIEAPETRAEKNKDERGTISCSFEKIDRTIQIIISDDGEGINKTKILQKALKNGLIREEDVTYMSEEDIFSLIFIDRFSTRDKVSEISGRGIGMSAIKAEIDALNGKLKVKSKEDIGTTFIFTLPCEEM